MCVNAFRHSYLIKSGVHFLFLYAGLDCFNWIVYFQFIFRYLIWNMFYMWLWRNFYQTSNNYPRGLSSSTYGSVITKISSSQYTFFSKWWNLLCLVHAYMRLWWVIANIVLPVHVNQNLPQDLIKPYYTAVNTDGAMIAPTEIRH